MLKAFSNMADMPYTTLPVEKLIPGRMVFLSNGSSCEYGYLFEGKYFNQHHEAIVWRPCEFRWITSFEAGVLGGEK